MLMGMDLDRMLHKCRRDQWALDAIDLSKPPRPMSKDDEIAIVQYFTDMAGIEMLASALFVEQKKRATDPRLIEIFESFVRDEVRHAQAAKTLARHYDAHGYQTYAPNPHLEKFAPAFVEAIRHLTPAIANVYITTGEILLDVALLRSLDDFVQDHACSTAMKLINRDESRHIAVDFHMVEHYSSDAYIAFEKTQPRRSLPEAVRAYSSLAKMLRHARPFFKAVFFEPMDLVDPSNKRLLEAFKRVQLLSTKPDVARRPFVKFMLTMQTLFRHPLLGALFGRWLIAIIGTDPRVIVKLYTDEEAAHAQRMSFDEMAEETLGLKYA